jgi:phage-related protein
MKEQKTVEVTIKVPKNVMEALKFFVLEHEGLTDQEWWQREAPGWVVADIDCICADKKLDPKPIIKRYGLKKYYHDC